MLRAVLLETLLPGLAFIKEEQDAQERAVSRIPNLRSLSLLFLLLFSVDLEDEIRACSTGSSPYDSPRIVWLNPSLSADFSLSCDCLSSLKIQHF